MLFKFKMRRNFEQIVKWFKALGCSEEETNSMLRDAIYLFKKFKMTDDETIKDMMDAYNLHINRSKQQEDGDTE